MKADDEVYDMNAQLIDFDAADRPVWCVLRMFVVDGLCYKMLESQQICRGVRCPTPQDAVRHDHTARRVGKVTFSAALAT
jgi:hypothetical protein